MNKRDEILLSFEPDQFIKLSKDLYFHMRCRIRVYELIKLVEEIEAKRKEKDGK